MGVIKFRIEKFSAYGLNCYRNFLAAPECECGCGAEANIVLESNDDLFGFMNAVMKEADFNVMCAVFAIDYDGAMYAGICNPDEDEIEICGIPEIDMEWFALVDADLDLSCYGLIIEVEPGIWKIIED